MPVHTDQNRGKADDLADDGTAGFVVDIINQPGGRGNQAEAAHTAGIAEHKADGKCRHSHDGKDFNQEGNERRLNSEHGEAENVYRNVAGDESAEPCGVRGM